MDAISSPPPALVECQRRSLWQNAEACAADWRRAQVKRPMPWESRWHCRDCAVGAVLAGHSVDEVARTRAIDDLRPLCVRCHQVTDRIILGRWCPSCYNRHREMVAGRNSRGGVPSVLVSKWRLRTVRLLSRGERWEPPARLDDVSSAIEAMLTLVRGAGRPLLMGRPSPQAGPQMSFWGGC